MPDGSPFSSIPDAETLEERFTFIESETTRQNLAICFQYVIFLTVVRSLYKQGGPVPLSLNRDIVVHTASIVESCLYYCVSRLIKLGEVDPDKLEKNWKNIGQGTIHKFTDIEQIVWVRQSKVANVFGTNPMSKDINKACLDLGILTEELYGKADKIRIARNNIHFIVEDKEVEYPTDDEVNMYFEFAGELLQVIKQKLTIS